MKTFIIKLIGETEEILSKVEADKMLVDDKGIVLFKVGEQVTGATQLSPSTVIYEERIPGPAPVIEMPKRVVGRKLVEG